MHGIGKTPFVHLLHGIQNSELCRKYKNFKILIMTIPRVFVFGTIIRQL
jgi:hypothetical protein